MIFIQLSVFAAGNCWKIKSADTKALKKFEGKKNCWIIKNSMRAYCEASAEGKNAKRE